MTNEKNTLRINVFLHDEEVQSFSDCLNTDIINNELDSYSVKESIGISGMIYVHPPTRNSPEWETDLNLLTDSEIILEQNVSNRAVIILDHDGRFFSITFGYGRYMLNLDTIINNFGLKVAANIIDIEKVKSLRSMSYENTILHTQKQVPKSVNQDQFRINKDLELLKEVTGTPSSESTVNFVAGSDSLKISQKMDIKDIKTSIEYYIEKYSSEDYISKGFGWIDNLLLVHDKRIKKNLDNQLCEDIVLNDTSVIISANDITDWDSVSGFKFKGIGKDSQESFELEDKPYLDYLRNKLSINPNYKVFKKLKRDYILQVNLDSTEEKLSTVYNGIYFETIIDEKRYFIEDGNWYEISSDFYDRIVTRLNNVETNSIILSDCLDSESEGEYNERIGKGKNIVSLDQNNFMIPGFGRSRIEVSDLITNDKQFIHVKKRKKNGSSVLSHWFAQGKTSAELMSQDLNYRNFINNEVKNKFGEGFISEENRNNDFEIIFALIVENKDSVIDNLPFFSMVNLDNTLNELVTSGFRVSLCKIETEILKSPVNEQLELIPN